MVVFKKTNECQMEMIVGGINNEFYDGGISEG